MKSMNYGGMKMKMGGTNAKVTVQKSAPKKVAKNKPQPTPSKKKC